MAQLVVGENSFISLSEANDIMSDNYMSTSKELTWWNGLSDNDKSVVVISATNKLNNETLMWIGQRVDDNQSLAFPRLDVRNGIEYDIDSTFKLGILKLVINDNETSTNEYAKLISAGVTSYKIKDCSVSFDVGTLANKNLGGFNKVGIPNDIFRTYFIKYSYLSM